MLLIRGPATVVKFYTENFSYKVTWFNEPQEMRDGGRQSDMMKVLWVVPRWTAWEILGQWMIVAGIDWGPQGTWYVLSSNFLSCVTAINSPTLEAEGVGSRWLEAQGRKDFAAWVKLTSIPHVPLGKHRNPPMTWPICRYLGDQIVLIFISSFSPWLFLLILTNSPSF